MTKQMTQSETAWHTVEHIHTALVEAESRREWNLCPNLRNHLIEEIYRYLKITREKNND